VTLVAIPNWIDLDRFGASAKLEALRFLESAKSVAVGCISLLSTVGVPVLLD